MFDSMWLNDEVVGEAVKGLSFAVANKLNENAVSLRLRSEIVEFLGRPLVSDSESANVIFAIGDAGLDDDEAFRITVTSAGQTRIEANRANGALYGLYAWIRRVAAGRQVDGVVESPSQSIRMIDQWDQTDGSVERGYAGESIFFGDLDSNDHTDFRTFPQRPKADPFRGDMARVEAYARFLASVGINAIDINNCNVRGRATDLMVQPLLGRVAQIARIFSGFGIATFLCINFAAPKKLGNLTTADPLDPQVRAWWSDIIDGIYDVIPDFGGFLVKADAEGEPGPMQYGRDHKDGANMLAEPMARHGGVVIWRTFVYNCKQDWRDRTTDRAKAAYENFKPLDGLFSDNVVLQVKFGPMDFQVREPLTPLIGTLEHTNLMVEFQITAEYLGHQIDVNYVLPQWLSITNFDTKASADGCGDSQVRSIVPSNSPNPKLSGFAGISNVGMDANWTGNSLAQANLYGFGRMCWDNAATAESILDEWMALTFPKASATAIAAIRDIMLSSNRTYENYCAPLGVGFMVVPGLHYGVSVNGYEYDHWGTYHFADRDGVGVDRTVATGSGYTAQYRPEVAAMYENLDTVPDELVLFFHHVPYTHRLHSGKTVIQHIYDTHFEGAARVDDYIEAWKEVEGQIPQSDWCNVAQRLQRQRDNAIAWRDQVNTYFYRMSGIPDERGRMIYA